MKPFVLDASVSASWCLKDESNDRADTLLGMLLETEAVVPPIWPVEMANVLIMAERKDLWSEVRLIEEWVPAETPVKNPFGGNEACGKLLGRLY